MKAVREPFVIINDLTVGYTSNPLFRDLSLTLFKGEFACLMGPNGIGKSTLVRTIAGLQQALRGNITIVGEGNIAEKLAVVLTDRITPQNMTVYDLICLGRYPYLNWTIKLSDYDEAKIHDAIELVRLLDLKDRSVIELSDGQLQLVMIARAIAQDTPVIILDEPTAHLDLNNRLEMMKLLRTIAHQGKGILVSTHDLDLALQTADTIWLSGHDQNIITGIPEDLVLTNAFDSIFQFKGFDLKTGKVKHDKGTRDVHVEGEGYALLWTRNALERNGFNISATAPDIVSIQTDDAGIHWKFHQENFRSLAALLEGLNSK